MAVKAEFKVEGLKELERRLLERKERLRTTLDMKIQQLAEEAPKEHQGVASNLERYCAEAGVVRPKGYSLVVVAGMEYGVYVEHKGYNVLYLTKYYLRDEMKKILEETLEEING